MRFGASRTPVIFCLKFDPEILYTASRSVFETRYVLPFTLSRHTPQKVFTRQEIESTPLPGLLRESLAEFDSKSYGFELAVKTNICRIFLWILRNWQAKGIKLEGDSQLQEKDLERLKNVFDLIDQSYMNNLTAKGMACRCNMSYSYFSRFFKAAIGRSFTGYLNYIRITEAEKLLITTDKTITDIAMETGFASTSYFISQFRRLKNFSPKQFRKHLRLTQNT